MLHQEHESRVYVLVKSLLGEGGVCVQLNLCICFQNYKNLLFSILE